MRFATVAGALLLAMVGMQHDGGSELLTQAGNLCLVAAALLCVGFIDLLTRASR